MKIGFFIEWDKNSLLSKKGNVVGDELYAESLCGAIRRISPSIEAEVYAPNFVPKECLDVMIYMNDTLPNCNWARQAIRYIQNGNNHTIDAILEQAYSRNYNGYIFFSDVFLKQHDTSNGKAIALPFAVDFNIFKPMPIDPKFVFDTAYIGNDIKGEERTMRYLYPAVTTNFGLFGNWQRKRTILPFIRNIKKEAPYKAVFEKISRGKIPQEKVPTLYSNAKINLNVTLQSCIDWDVITLRTYEVLACKGFLITDIVPIAKKTMQDCMIFTDGGDDLREKIEYFLVNDKERNEIAQNGYEYVRKYASIEARANELVKFLE